MPITVGPISRRRFLAASLAGVATVALGDRWLGAAAEEGRDPHRVVFFSDTHVPQNPKASERGVNMTNNFRQAVGQVLEWEKTEARPGAAIISGDCAYHTGETADYAALLGVIDPLNQAGLPVHLAMGNHDQRERFWAAVPYQKLGANAAKRGMESRHLLVLRSPRVDWVLLDSLDKTNASPGLVGPEQLKWLQTFLDTSEQSRRPTMIVLHHDPVSAPPPATGPASTRPAKAPSLVDAKGLMEVLLPRKQVKAIVYGHTHVWSVRQVEGLHLVNLPPVAYVFDPDQPSGWVDGRIGERGMRLELHCLKTSHRKHGEAVELAWRS